VVAHEAADEPAAPTTEATTDATPSPSGPSTAVIPREPAAPSTAVIPRDGSQPRGKRPQRHQTFATHVELEGMLSKATPASTDEPEPDGEPDVISSAARDSRRMRARSEKPGPDEESAADRRGMVAPPLPVPGRAPPSRAVLVLLGLGGIGLAIAAVYVFYQGRAQVLRPDAPREAAVPDAELDAPTPDAAPLDGGADAAADAAVHVDAAVRMVALDAAVLRPDAAPSRPDAAAAAALATLKVGADPWGEIFVDGKASGNTPRELAIPAGHHTIEVVFPGVNPPRKQTFAVDLAGGETKSVQADFH